jgi:4-hydroxy-4-methyl-2-oxoglutarate aldolase
MASETELDGVRGRLFGLIGEEAIRLVSFARPPSESIAALRSLTDLCSTIADAMDDLGVGAAIAGTDLHRRVPGTRVVGPAVTIRYAREDGTAGARIARGEGARLADRDVYGVGQPGDVAVFDCGGAADASVLGGLSARWARQMDIAGCVVDGAVRDLDSIRADGVPVWSRAVTPNTGKHRMRAVEINAEVCLDGHLVSPGDVIAADGSGVCVIPAEALNDVLGRCVQADRNERAIVAALAGEPTPAELQGILAGDRW